MFFAPKRLIKIGDWMCKSPITSFDDLILHEIAHANAGPGAGHGPIWKAEARRIGCTADRCMPKKYLGTRADLVVARCTHISDQCVVNFSIIKTDNVLLMTFTVKNTRKY